MSNINNVGGCKLPPTPKEMDILLAKILREIKELKDSTEAKLLYHDGKIAELCKYIKDNLSSTLRCMIEDMKKNGELDSIILDSITELNDEFKLINKTVGLRFVPLSR